MRFERRFSGRRQLRRDLELTPMVDVVMQLIIFFMLSSTFVVYSGIRVDLPESERSKAQKKQELTISITADNTIYVNELRVPFDELATVLANKAKELKEDQLVMIKCDRVVQYGRLIRVLDVAHGAGITRYGLMTRPGAPTTS